MNRNRFIAALSTLAAAPSLAFSGLKKTFQMSKGFKINAGEGRKHGHIKLKGVNANVLDVKISGTDTDGGLAIFEQTSLSPGRGTPLHVHPSQDEVFYVLEGAYYFQVGDEKYHLKTGDSIFLPRKVPHAWTQVAEKGKMMVVLQPAGKLEYFFVTMAGMDHEPTKEELAKVFSDNEMQVVGPPLKIE
ncbi:cupin domain-containing protein [Spirosoma validum]|uniref:Cupin domain-containing protein n=1 Tax=Spirosoma validum TaxID=2771355 RepID=A0A927GFS7_9BACT|nr:cupin domain-containing protein [Spirosoma validum]MBD2755890.1 cupin domain-containing protein [Spirosoma validum]